MPLVTTGIKKVVRAFDRERASNDLNTGLQHILCHKVLTSDMTIDPLMAMFAQDPNGNSPPFITQQHPNPDFPFLYCTNILPERDKATPFQHLIWSTFSAINFGASDRWNIGVDGDGVENEESAYVDLDGKLIGNSSGVPYDGGAKESYYDETFNLSFNANAMDFDNLADCRGCVNTSPITFTIWGTTRTFEAYSLLLKNAIWSTVVSPIITAATQNYFKIKYLFLYREPDFDGDRPWNTKLIDQGSYVYLAVPNPDLTTEFVRVPLPDQSGQPCTTPALLDGHGNLLIQPGDDPASKTAIFYPQDGSGNPTGFRLVDDVDFSDLLSGLTIVDGT